MDKHEGIDLYQQRAIKVRQIEQGTSQSDLREVPGQGPGSVRHGVRGNVH
jgi:hypothetical protein